ncbi:tetratricopeptide repeat-containing sensor histidine kinase [Filimonas lacunae]|nr:histidine kinase dimerization/phosphoacceptor domain -containing protein [Filimonas lacunae]BAV06941.1 sensor histidine kinase [Filimonas lacunae]
MNVLAGRIRQLGMMLLLFAVTAYESNARYKGSYNVEDTAAINATLAKALLLVNKPGEVAADLDAAQKLAEQALHASFGGRYRLGEGVAYTLLSKIYREKNEREKGHQFASRAVGLFTGNVQYPAQQADALIELADYSSIDDSVGLVHKIGLYRQATDMMDKAVTGDLKSADATKFLGDLYMLYRRYDSAKYYVQKSLAIYQANRYGQLQDVYSLLGVIYYNQFNRRLALKYELLAMEVAEKFKDSSALVVAIYNRLGMLYTRMDHDSVATAYYLKAITLAEKNNNDDRFRLYVNVAQMHIRSRRLKDAEILLEKGIREYPPRDTIQDDYADLLNTLLGVYALTRQCKQGELLQSRMKKIVEQHPGELDVITLHNFHHFSSMLFMANGQYDESGEHIDAMEQLNQRDKYITSSNRTIAYLRYQLDSSRNNLASALMYYKRFSDERDLLTKKNYDQDLAGLEVEYETKKRDLELGTRAEAIKNLQAQAQLQQKALQSRQLTRNLALVGIILLGLLLALLYNRFRYKQQTTRILNSQNENLKQLLAEREWLLKDVNHRVKNNLQIVISLLDAQMADLTDDKALHMVRGSQQRMHAISLIHKKLSLTEKYTSIPMQEYIPELAEECRKSMDAIRVAGITTEVDAVLLDVSQAVSVGLIINEAITNAYKYAFTDRKANARIAIRLRAINETSVKLTITDNGVGVADTSLLAQSSSLGMTLIQGLATQLNGKATFVSENGFSVQVTFQKMAVMNLQPAEVVAVAV